MEEKKAQQLEKKVRFDLNEEVFLIPSKWDRLSKSRAARNGNLIDDPKPKTRASGERRVGSKHNRSKKAQKASMVGKANSSPETIATCADNERPNSSPSLKISGVKRTSREHEGQDYGSNGRNSTSPAGVRLKLSHRPIQELPGVDFVLPKIPYTPVLKKAIEKALQRSRTMSKPTEFGDKISPAEQTGKKRELFNFLPKETATEKVFQRRVSESSLKTGNELSTETSPETGNGIEDSSKFSELSSKLDGWSPFSAWGSKENALQSKPPIKRVRSMSSLIPNSILY